MSSEQTKHIVPYKVYILVLASLLALTFISVAVTSIETGTFTVLVALLFASVKTFLVLVFFMHLKFDSVFYKIMIGAVIVVLGIVMFITYLDYLYRV